MIQGELFSMPAIACKKKALQALETLDFQQFHEYALMAQRIDPALAGMESLRKIGAYLEKRQQKFPDVRFFVAQTWDDIPKMVLQHKLTRSEAEFADTILARIARRNIEREHALYIDADELLHWGCMDVCLKQVEEGHKLLLDTLDSSDELRADLLGYFGDAAWMLNNMNEANTAYLLALITDPYSIDLFRLKHPDIRQLFSHLKQTYSDTEARSLLLTHAWMEDTIQVPKGGTWLTAKVKKINEVLQTELPKENARRWHHFSVCLYLDQASSDDQINYRVREQMQMLDAALFKQYLQELNK